MGYVQTSLIIIRNLYITVMFLPLWFWSVDYRYHLFDLSLGDGSWYIFSVLALLYGAFGLWFFAEKAVVTHYSGKPSRGLTINVWIIALTLFVTCLGSVVDRGSNVVNEVKSDQVLRFRVINQRQE